MFLSNIIPLAAGLLAGWIVNYAADVLPVTRRLSRPVCLRCGQEIAFADYLLLRKCRNGHPRSWRAWTVLFLGVASSFSTWQQPPRELGFILGLTLTIYFGVVLVIDLEHRLILHPTSIVGAGLGILTGFLSHGAGPSLIGGLSGLGIMFLLYFMGVLFSRYRARRMRSLGQEPDDEEALGAGDVILVTVLGFMLGWPLIWFGLITGVLLGGAVSMVIVVWQLILKKYRENALMLFIPFGPYFIISAYLIIFFPVWLSYFLPE
jgi:prepilin signal peptidase PulO-like enzyme (type II secretory pathway)